MTDVLTVHSILLYCAVAGRADAGTYSKIVHLVGEKTGASANNFDLGSSLGVLLDLLSPKKQAD